MHVHGNGVVRGGETDPKLIVGAHGLDLRLFLEFWASIQFLKTIQLVL